MNGVNHSNMGLKQSTYNWSGDQIFNGPAIDMTGYRRFAFLLRGSAFHKFYAAVQFSPTGMTDDYYDYTSLFHDGSAFSNYVYEIETAVQYWRIQIRWYDGGGYVYHDLIRRN